VGVSGQTMGHLSLVGISRITCSGTETMARAFEAQLTFGRLKYLQGYLSLALDLRFLVFLGVFM